MMYKYWLYYLDDELYAYTDNKELAQSFEEIRDMKKIKRIKKKITKEELNYLASEYQDLYLESFETDIYNRDNQTSFKGSITITRLERVTISNMSIQILEEERFRHCWCINPVVFKRKIYKALKEIMFVDAYKYITRENELDYIMDCYNDTEEHIQYKPDYLGIFLRYYGNTLRGDK